MSNWKVPFFPSSPRRVMCHSLALLLAPLTLRLESLSYRLRAERRQRRRGRGHRADRREPPKNQALVKDDRLLQTPLRILVTRQEDSNTGHTWTTSRSPQLQAGIVNGGIIAENYGQTCNGQRHVHSLLPDACNDQRGGRQYVRCPRGLTIFGHCERRGTQNRNHEPTIGKLKKATSPAHTVRQMRKTDLSCRRLAPSIVLNSALSFDCCVVPLAARASYASELNEAVDTLRIRLPRTPAGLDSMPTHMSRYLLLRAWLQATQQ